MNKKKTLWICLGILAALIVAAVTSIAIFIIGRNTSTVEIFLEEESYTVEYGDIFVVPMAYSSTGEEVSVAAYDADGYEVDINYGTCNFEKGENKLVYTLGAVAKEVPVICSDTLPPEVLVRCIPYAAVGHRYILPTYTTNDISGVDPQYDKIELYRGDETTPIATGSGERIDVEDVESYTMKITVGDMDGNVQTIEYPIRVIVRPETEVLQDFSTEIIPYHDTWWGSGDAVQSWHEEFAGRQGVIGMGSDNFPEEYTLYYAWFTGIGMDKLNLVGCTKLTFKFKVDPSLCRAVFFKHEGSGPDEYIWTRGDTSDWVEVTVNLLNVNFTDVTAVNIGIAIATDGPGECVWLDEVVADYRPLPEYKVTIENGTMDYPYEYVPESQVITLTHDDGATPEGKTFIYWKANRTKRMSFNSTALHK